MLWQLSFVVGVVCDRRRVVERVFDVDLELYLGAFAYLLLDGLEGVFG